MVGEKLSESKPIDGEGPDSGALPSNRPILELSGIAKTYGHTVAALDVSLTISAGEMVAVAGHNGAGKSTVVKIIGGIVEQDEGSIVVDGTTLPVPHSVQSARQAGVALAFQEITLFPDLRVFEHVGAVEPSMLQRGWRKKAVRAIQDRLDAMFPSHGISPHALVATLSLAQRQMLQNVLTTMHKDEAKLLILDEPTSSLPDDLAQQLFEWLARERRESGLSVILVSHKMADIFNHSDRTVVMRDGAVVSDRPTSELSARGLMTDMGAVHGEPENSVAPGVTTTDPDAQPVLEIRELEWRGLQKVSLSVGPGEIVGLAGLEANGQQEILEAAWRARKWTQPRKVRQSTQLNGTVAYVSGDRQEEGLFPYWSVGRNITIGSLGDISRLGIVSRGKETERTSEWVDRVSIKAEGEDPIVSLSGGNQQKVLLARGMSQAPRLLILDDPFRGVDVTTKAEAYRQLRELTSDGTSILWYTTENSELLECDRVFVLRGGEVSAVLSADQLNVEQIILASFGESADDEGADG